ncbi:MAG: DUF3795 domain-containing protein [Desulfovermiculus sp.]
MAKKGKRKLTPAQKRKKKLRKAEYQTIFINGKQKRIKREPTIDGMSEDEFIRCNADPIWLHQNQMWEYLYRHEKEESMNINPDLVAPCGLYCGVCAVYIAHRDQNQKFKERLLSVYKGEIPGKGKLPNSENLTLDDIRCNGCLSDDIFMHCRQCAIRDCTQEQGYAGCHQCDDFPCPHIDDFPMTIGKKVILRAIPYWREAGTEKWIEDEEARYICPECGNTLFRGVVTCNRCKAEVDLD